MTRTPEPLGRLLGRVLDRSALPESGSAVVVHTGPGGSEECRVHWRTASVWRVQTRRSLSASDGTTTWGTDADHPTRQGWPPWHLQLVFPLRAPVWGRLGDDYYPAAVATEADGLRVHLDGTEDDRRGSLLVDSTHGFLREIRFSDGSRLELRDVDLRPQPDELFVRP